MELVIIMGGGINVTGVRVRGVVPKGEWRIIIGVSISLEGIIEGEVSPTIGECQEILIIEGEGEMCIRDSSIYSEKMLGIVFSENGLNSNQLTGHRIPACCVVPASFPNCNHIW